MSGSPQIVPYNCVAVGEPSGGAVNGDANCDHEIDVPDVTATLQLVAGLPVPTCYSTTLASSGQVSKVIGPEGGLLSTTGPDGSTFSLQVPENALTGAQLIEMTPVTAVANLPLSGGFVAGVDLQPSGLIFWEPVTLTITPATSVAPNSETAFLLSNGEFSLAPPLPVGGPIQISLTHFTTGAIGNGTASDRATAVNNAPNAEAAFDAAAADATRSGRDGSDPGFAQKLIAAAQSYYDSEIAPNLQRAAADCNFGHTFIPKANGWARQLSFLGTAVDFAGQINAIMQASVQNLAACFNDAATRCNNHDLTGITDMLTYRHELTILNEASLVDETKIEKCAHFKLEFNSELCLSFTPLNPGSCPNQIDVQFTALDIKWGGVLAAPPEAQGPMSFVKAVGPNSSATSSGSTFQVVTGGVYLNQIAQTGKVVHNPQVSMVIQPGQPIEHWTTSSGSYDASFWYNRFCAVHAGELVGHPAANALTCISNALQNGAAQYKIGDWQKLGGELYAQKTYDRSYGGITVSDGGAVPQGGPPPYGWERTTLKLYHLPE